MEESLLTNLHPFTVFVRSRVGDPYLADDGVQDSLVKTLAAEKQPFARDDAVTWFSGYSAIPCSVLTRNNLTVRMHPAQGR